MSYLREIYLKWLKENQQDNQKVIKEFENIKAVNWKELIENDKNGQIKKIG